MENLTARVLEYQRSQQGLEGLVSEIAPRVLHYPKRRFGWDEDACSEFYLFVYPRLLRVLGRFRDQGKPFESYLASVLHWQARSFARQRKKDERLWDMGFRLRAADSTRAGRASRPGRPSAWPPAPRCQASPRLSAHDRGRLLYLVLKCCRRLEPEHLAAAAEATGCTPRRLAGLVELLRVGLAPAEQRLATLRERRNRAFARPGSWRPSSPAIRTPTRPERCGFGSPRQTAAWPRPSTAWPGSAAIRRTARWPRCSACPRAPWTAACSG